MSRHVIAIYSETDRERARKYVTAAPIGTRIEYKALKRSLPQNDLMWAILTEVALQKDHCGRKYSPDIWKLLFMDAFGREVQFAPSLTGKTVVPINQSTSTLSKSEMTELIDFIDAWCAQNGVTLHGPHEPPKAAE